MKREGEIIVFFDGDCLMCQGAMKWLHRLDAQDRLRFAPLEGKTAKEWRISREVDSMAVVREGVTFRASEAARLAFAGAGGVGGLAAMLMKLIPVNVRDAIYYQIAKRRKRFFRKSACGIPEEGLVAKMME